MTEATGLLAGLNNLPVFEGVPDAERRRALLETGLAMMQPYNPLEGNPLTQVGGGVAAGLSALDRQRGERQASEQQDFQNILSGRAASADETRAGAAVTSAQAAQTGAEASAQNAATSSQAEQRAGEEFEATAADREAVNELRKAEAEWLRRRHDGSPAGSTAHVLEQQRIDATMSTLINQKPGRYTRPDGTVDMALARVDAYGVLGLDELLKNPALPIIVQNAEQGGEIRDVVQSLQPDFAGQDERVGAEAGPVTVTGQEDFDAKKASGAIKSGDTVIYNGQSFVVD